MKRHDTNEPPHVLVIDTNNPVPRDRRVWLECRALADDGYRVTVICPGRAGLADYEEVDGIPIHRYAAGRKSNAAGSFAADYVTSAWRTFRLSRRIWRARPFQLMQACNPPDTYFPIAAAYKLRGVKFLFDQHDPCPEVYGDRFGRTSGPTMAMLRLLERLTHRTADHVITVNESCRELLLARTSSTPQTLTVVRTGADLARLRRTAADETIRNGRRFLCAYLGIMGPQDGVDLALHAVDHLVHRMGRTDVQFVFMGIGECLEQLQELTRELRIEPWVAFTGYADDATISTVLSTADLGLQPDKKTPFTELCSMVKTIEYLYFGLPVVSMDLTETRRTVGDAALYVAEESPGAYAQAIADLLDDEVQRERMSQHAQARANSDLSWERQKAAYLDVVHALCGRAPAGAVQEDLPVRVTR